ncbi:hypothetical protein AM588_10006693 [Phytophthora nicotianae]|uniref:Inositol-tetrakisphosphate 1-kinase n=1 Tax=Phytophthora nicotianae TaxID=4792 RepID=A0A0W8D8V9_PHYNI|nr:hypothetical protein AM588_10006693 [Phytophthora nicotianae]
MSSSEPLVVGVIFPVKKIARLQEVLDVEADSVRFVLIDLEAAIPTGASVTDADLEAAAMRLAAYYGPLDVLLHKLAHDMVFAGLGNQDAANRVQLVQHFLRRHPSVRVVDPIDSVRLLTDRHAACKMLRSMEQNGNIRTQRFKVPNFYEVKSLEQFQALQEELGARRTKLPLICKSVEACERRSLPNLVAGTAQHVHFDTQQNYPTSRDFHPHVDDSTSQEEIVGGWTQEEIFAGVREIGKCLRDELKLTLFGFDVIVADDGSQELYVIDVNYFPSYRELDDLDSILRKHIKQLCGRQ